MTMKKDLRKMTISYAYHETEDKCVSVPYIRIKRRWLQELGFRRGQNIRIQTIDKKLIIKVEEST